MSESAVRSRAWRRGLFLSWLAWTAYSIFEAAILAWQANILYVYALSSTLLSNYVMALYTIPVWFWATRVLGKGWWLLRITGHLFGALIFAVLWYWSYITLFRSIFGEEIFRLAQFEQNRLWLLLQAMTIYAAIVGIFYVWRYHQQLREKEQREAELRLHANQMELAVLKAQLNPHFLFNTLNSINALVGSDPEAARRVLAQLAEVLRYSLESDRQPLVPLSEELRFVETYLTIEKARFGRRLQVRMEIDESARPLLVPPMILQPLAENAVRHGIAPKEDGGEILLRVQRRDKHLEIEVADNGMGAAMTKPEELLKNGTGLRNTDLRLRKMFGEASGLQMSNRNDGFRVRFQIPVISNQFMSSS
ncbi:MAG: histidine kinase [candidate division KSB1 bacterium]|nr:histidine kinase [candidate division KSB1 bacterium]MDZ7304522.1 histidine kinase [candidate division KSB1 bacterium]MDZ7314424.1 histidine kinase [candidate division KSB1 bacterium]